VLFFLFCYFCHRSSLGSVKAMDLHPASLGSFLLVPIWVIGGGRKDSTPALVKVVP